MLRETNFLNWTKANAPAIQNFETIAAREGIEGGVGGQVPLEEEAERARLLLLLLPLAPLPLPRMKEACVTTRRWRRTPGAIAKSRLELGAIACVALALGACCQKFLAGPQSSMCHVCHKNSLGQMLDRLGRPGKASSCAVIGHVGFDIKVVLALLLGLTS